MADGILDSAIFELAEELSQSLGLSIPAPDLVQVAGVMLATEAVKSGLALLIPSASSAVTFSTTGLTLAFIQRKLRDISKKIDTLLDAGRKSAKDNLTEALTSLEHENYADAFEAFKKAADKATDGFNTAQDNEGRVSCTKIKLFAILMTKCYDKGKNIFLPFASLGPKRKTEVASLMRTAVDNLLDEMKCGKSSIDLMDIVMFKAGVKKKMLQVRLNELFVSSYRFISEGLEWTKPSLHLNEESDVVKIQVHPEYLPIGDKEDAMELVIGKGKIIPNIAISMHRVLLDKKTEKLAVHNTEFLIDSSLENVIMIELFAGKIAVHHDETNMLLTAARVGRTDLIKSTLESKPELNINAKNFKEESALILAARHGNNEALKAILECSKQVDCKISDTKGNSALHYAAQQGNLEALTVLLKHTESVDLLNNQNESPLSLAASRGHEAAVQLLLKWNANINHRTEAGSTPLFLAAENSHVEVVRLLLKAKVDPMMGRASDNASPVWIAASNGHLEVIKVMAKALTKQKMKQPNSEGVIPATAASRNQHVLVFMFLKKQGAA